jgi:hypothetical protein
MKNKLNSANAKVVFEAMNGINYMTKRYCTEEDVRQTVHMTFFQCIQRYERKDSDKGPIPFSAFLYSYFFYLLKKNVDTFLIDQLGRKSFAIADNYDHNEEDGGQTSGVNIETLDHAVYDLIFAEEVDEFWVKGDTARSPFDELTVQERQLIKWRYIDKKRSSEIALKITEHPNTVREHISKIKEKIVKILEDNNMKDVIILKPNKKDL